MPPLLYTAWIIPGMTRLLIRRLYTLESSIFLQSDDCIKPKHFVFIYKTKNFVYQSVVLVSFLASGARNHNARASQKHEL